MVDKKPNSQPKPRKARSANTIKAPAEHACGESARSPRWTWPTVTLACVLVLAALAFAFALIVLRIVTPWTAVALTVVLVGGILALVMPAPKVRATLDWLLKVLKAMAGEPNGPK